MADDGMGCDQPQVRLYVGSVTEAPQEPTLADVMEYLKQFSGHVMAELAKTNGKLDALDAKVDAVETSLRHEIRDSENRLGRRIDDVQNVVRTLKADLAEHIGNPDNHHRHAA